MKHLQFIIILTAVNTSLLTLLSSVLIYYKTRKGEYLYRAALIISFMFIILPFMVDNYLFNLTNSVNYISQEFPTVGIILLIATLVIYVNSFNILNNKNKINLFFISLSAGFSIHGIFSIIIGLDIYFAMIAHSICLAIAILYTGLMMLRGKYKTINRSVLINRRIIGFIALLFLPLFIFIDVLRIPDIFEMLNISRTVIAVPLFLSLWNLFFLHEDITSLIHKAHSKNFKDFCSEFKFTPREEETGSLLIEGYTYEEIGIKLFVSKETIKSHVKNIYSKTGVKNKIQLIGKIKNFMT